MKILVTGGRFIGSHLCEFLIKKEINKIIILDNLEDGSKKILKIF